LYCCSGLLGAIRKLREYLYGENWEEDERPDILIITNLTQERL